MAEMARRSIGQEAWFEGVVVEPPVSNGYTAVTYSPAAAGRLHEANVGSLDSISDLLVECIIQAGQKPIELIVNIDREHFPQSGA